MSDTPEIQKSKQKTNRKTKQKKSDTDSLDTTTPTTSTQPKPIDPKIYVGWDIGIKNLAYCIIKQCAEPATSTPTSTSIIKVNNNYYEIISWDVINLLEQVETNLSEAGQVSGNAGLKCTHGKKNGTGVCDKTASWCRSTLTESGEYYGLCNTHYKTVKAIPNEIAEYYKSPISKCTTHGCKKSAYCVSATHIYKAFCKTHMKSQVKAGEYTEASFHTVNKSKSASTVSLTLLGKSLFQELKKRPQLLTANHILLENQPVLKNPTMKSMQMFVYSYFINEGMLSQADNVNVTDIQCYSASKKLDLINLINQESADEMNKIIKKQKNSYAQGKQLAILLTEYFTSVDNTSHQLNEFFKNHKKRDDLADSMLMTLHYMQRDNIAKIIKTKKKVALA